MNIRGLSHSLLVFLLNGVFHTDFDGYNPVFLCRSESTYANNPFVQCSYVPVSSSSVPSCIPGAHPPNVCPGSGVTCPACDKSACPCPKVASSGAFQLSTSCGTCSKLSPLHSQLGRLSAWPAPAATISASMLLTTVLVLLLVVGANSATTVSE